MKDEEKIFAELKVRATDPEHEQALADLCRALLAEFESKMSEGVCSVVEAHMQELRNAYNCAHRALTKKMALNQGE